LSTTPRAAQAIRASVSKTYKHRKRLLATQQSAIQFKASPKGIVLYNQAVL